MKKIITIAREFGAGGGEIGRRTANELGIAYYDRDIILKTAVASGKLDPEQVRRWDERVPSSFGFAQSLFDFYNKPLDEEIWNAQMEAIRDLANQESCVIVGRNSDYILAEFDHCLRVFVHARGAHGRDDEGRRAGAGPRGRQGGRPRQKALLRVLYAQILRRRQKL